MAGVRKGVGFAPGKVILLGEHSVVYGHPAIAASLDRGLTARCALQPGASLSLCVDAPDIALLTPPIPLDLGDPHLGLSLERRGGVVEAVARCVATRPICEGALTVTLSSELLPGRGMGSSAAVAVATLRALDALCDQHTDAQSLAVEANDIEAIFHGTPSGVDVAVIAQGGIHRFQKGPPLDLRPLRAARPLEVVLLDSAAAGSTVRLVAGVRRRYDAAPEAVGHILETLSHIAESGIQAVESGDLPRLGGLFDRCHEALQALGVSTPRLDELTVLARQQGALGAKLTGGGGGGLVIALMASDLDAQHLVAVAGEAGVAAWRATLGRKEV